jgi:hypothetical protein
MKLSRAVTTGVALVISLVSSASAVTNEWTKPSSGSWEEPFWSLGRLPAADQEMVALRNPGWKALAIGANTTANYPGSLQVNNLIIDAPTDSGNRLLLNWAGHDVPLMVRSNLMIGTNGSLVGHYSALRAANVELGGFAAFSDNATAALDRVALWPRAALNLNDATLSSSNLVFLGGSVTQSMGVAVFSKITTEDQWSWIGPPWRFHNTYVLSGGVLYSGVADIGHYGLSGRDDFAFWQSGGVHSNTSMTLWGGQRSSQIIDHAGHYSLSSGLLVSGQTMAFGGTIVQNGGTNLTRELIISQGGYFTLNDGQLVTSNTSVGSVDCFRLGFDQNGGSHIVQNRLVINHAAIYGVSAGTLSAPIIEIHADGEFAWTGGEVSNSGMVVLRRGRIRVEGHGRTRQFGKLQVLEGNGVGCSAEPDIPAVLDMGSTEVVLRFQDSRDVPWGATLQIRNYRPLVDGIFVGTSAQGLTSAQLQRIVFLYPGGSGTYTYPAQILANGRIVPNANRPSLGYSTRSRPLVLSWDGNYSLWTTTNLVGTWSVILGATSPYTNSFPDPQRFFQLRSPTR